MLGAIEIAVIAAVVGGLAIALWRSLNERQSVERWARDSGLRLTSDNRAYRSSASNGHKGSSRVHHSFLAR